VGGTHEGNLPIGAQGYGDAEGVVTVNAIAGLQLLLLGPAPAPLLEDVRCSLAVVRAISTHEGDVLAGAQRYGVAEGVELSTIAGAQLLLLGPASAPLLEDVRCSHVDVLGIGTHNRHIPAGAQGYGDAELVI